MPPAFKPTPRSRRKGKPRGPTGDIADPAAGPFTEPGENGACGKSDLATYWAAADLPALLACAQERPAIVMRFVTGRLYSSDEQEKWRAVETLGRLIERTDIIPERQVVELLRRFVWALNDESGAVPFGIPEAMGEVLLGRPDLRSEFLPILGSILTEASMSQTGAIERGVIWALGRVGPPSTSCQNVTETLHRISQAHPDPETRAIARHALSRMGLVPEQ